MLKKLTAELKGGEELFLSLIDAHGKILSANAKMNREFKVPAPGRDCFYSLLRSGQVEKFKSFLDHNSFHQESWIDLHLENHIYPHMKWQVSPLGNEKGISELFLCIGVRSASSQTWLQSKQEIEFENIVKSFMEKTSHLSWIMDLEGHLVLASRSFCQFFRIEESKINQQNVFLQLPSEFEESLRESCLRMVQSNGPESLVEKINRSDGSQFIFRTNIFPIRSNDGKTLVGCNAVDITDKARVQKKLQETTDRLLLLSRATSDAIWEWDMQSGHIFRNDALMEMIGYQQDNGKGLSWWLRRIHPEDRNKVTDAIKIATDNSRQSWEQQYRFRFANGEYKPVQDRGFIVYENGLPVRMIGSLQDLSEIKALEDRWGNERLALQKELSETVIRVQEQERTRIGHELHDNVNQILSTTKLFMEMLTPISKNDKEIKQKSIEYIRMAIEEIRKLSRELVVPQLKEKLLVDNIQTLIDDIQLSGTVKIKFVHDVENDLLTPGKKITLFRILQEQLKNILKHSQARQVDIFLQCRSENAELIIRDNGVGFDPQQASRGIGLSNIRERVKYYNGSVEVQTAPGKGCTLIIKIPIGQ